MKKNFIIIALIVINTFLLTSCSYVAYKTYYTNEKDYSQIWALAGVSTGNKDIHDLFPTEISNLSVEEFFCRYDEQIPLGEGVQVFLKVHYEDKESFLAELERISLLAYSCDEHFQGSDMSAYATSMGEGSLWEYSLIDEQQQLIYYIYLRFLPKDEIEIENSMLPINMNSENDFLIEEG